MSTADEEAVVDFGALRALVGEDEAVIQDLLRTYLTIGNAALRDIESAMKHCDSATVQQLSHKLKSSSRSVGARRMAEAFAALEDTVARGEWLQATCAHERLRTLWPGVTALLETVALPAGAGPSRGARSASAPASRADRGGND